MCWEWCKQNPLLCILAVALIITLLIMWFSPKEKLNSPSVLANPNVATGLARSAEDIARNSKGYTILDLDLDQYMLAKQLGGPVTA